MRTDRDGWLTLDPVPSRALELRVPGRSAVPVQMAAGETEASMAIELPAGGGR